MRIIGKCLNCGKKGYVNNENNLCRKCQNKKDSEGR